MLGEVDKYRKLKPEWVPVDDDGFENLKREINLEIMDQGFTQEFGHIA